MEMYVKRYCMKIEVRNSNTTLHTSKAQMQCQKQKSIIKRCVIIRGNNKYTLIYHRFKSTSKWNMNHVEHTSYSRHYVSTQMLWLMSCGHWLSVGIGTLIICSVKARINNLAWKIEWMPRITDGQQSRSQREFTVAKTLLELYEDLSQQSEPKVVFFILKKEDMDSISMSANIKIKRRS